MKEIFTEVGTPEEINSDNAKEFISKEVEEFYLDSEIKHHCTSVEKHTSNGRVERAIRMIRDGMVKLGDRMTLEDKLRKIEVAYNDTYHTGIGITPNEAWKDEKGIAAEANSISGKYKERFKKLKREKFYVEQQVRIAQVENLKQKGKSGERYQELGVIVEEC